MTNAAIAAASPLEAGVWAHATFCRKAGTRRVYQRGSIPVMATRQELQAGFRIGECLIEPRQNRIVRGEIEVRLEPRVMDVLVCLAEHAGEVVSRETLNEQVWGNVIVTDQAVTNCISELRHHLGDDRSAHRVIETIPKRGYRLTAPVLAAPLQLAATQRRTLDRRQTLACRRRAAARGRLSTGRVVVVANRGGANSHQRGRDALRERGRR